MKPEFIVSLLPDEYATLTREVTDSLTHNQPDGPEVQKLKMRLRMAGWVPYQPVRLRVVRESGRPLYPGL